MIKLLKGDFVRLFKSKIFWLGTFFMFGFAVFGVYSRWNDIQRIPDYYNPSDGMLFAGAMYIAIVIAVVIGSFIGTDYKNGTVHNKLTIGHSKLSMYLSNLIICAVTSIIMHTIWFFVFFASEKLGLIQGFETPYTKIISLVLISFLPIVAFTSLFMMICMLITSKSAGSVTVLVLSFIMLVAVTVIRSDLSAPEYYEPYTYTYTNANGEIIEEHYEREKNHFYITGTKRKVYEFLYDFIPNGQIMQIADMESITTDRIEIVSLYSLSLIAMTTGVGILLFRKKDLK